MLRLTHNILNLTDKTTQVEWDEGLEWYRLRNHEFPTPTAAGVVAALSPNNSWKMNQKQARQALAERSTENIGHTSLCKRRAQAIMDGSSPYTILGGNKTRNFFRNIYEPDRPGPVTVDRHAYAIALGIDPKEARSNPPNYKKLYNKGQYRAVQGAFNTAGRVLNITGAQIQAITWLTHRRISGADVY